MNFEKCDKIFKIHEKNANIYKECEMDYLKKIEEVSKKNIPSHQKFKYQFKLKKVPRNLEEILKKNIS